MTTPNLLEQFPKLSFVEPDELEDEWQKRGVFIIPHSIKDIEKLTRVVAGATFAGNTQPLYFLIHSTGGKTVPSWLLSNFIRSYRGPTIGIALGQVCSCAFLLLQSCMIRLALPGSRGLIHSISADYPLTSYNEDEVKLRQELIRAETRSMLEYLAARNPRAKVETLETLARLDESFLLTPESGWVDGMIDKIPPVHPLPTEWMKKIYTQVTQNGQYFVT